MPPRKKPKSAAYIADDAGSETRATSSGSRPRSVPQIEITIPVVKLTNKRKRPEATETSSSTTKVSKSKGKTRQLEPHMQDAIYPTNEEFDDVNIFQRYKTCQLNGIHWQTGDFIHVKGEGKVNPERIQSIRASGVARVFCRVDWVYTSLDMLRTDAGCRKLPNRQIIQFPDEVVLGQGEALTSLISIQCVNDTATVVHFDEANPFQDSIPYDGTVFYRSRVRPPTQEEIGQEEKIANKLTGKRKTDKLWSMKYPIHEFEQPPTCICNKHYAPLPAGIDPMILCPRTGCMKWFHLTCLEDLPEKHLYGTTAMTGLAHSGLELLRAQRGRGQTDYLTDHADPVDHTGRPASYFSSRPTDDQGVPLILTHAAESSITRGNAASGIVGNARAILEARDLRRVIQVELESAKQDLDQVENLLGKKKGKAKGKKSGKNGDERILQILDGETKKKLGIWLRLYGEVKWDVVDKWDGEDMGGSGNAENRRGRCWICPHCRDAI